MSFIQRLESNSEITSGWKDYLKKDEELPIVESLGKDPKDEPSFEEEDITPERAIHKEAKEKKEAIKKAKVDKKSTQKPEKPKPAEPKPEPKKENDEMKLTKEPVQKKEKTTPEEPTDKEDPKDGEFKKADNRLEEIKSMAPLLLVVSSVDNPPERTNFFRALKPYVNNPAFHMILSADSPKKETLKFIDAMFIGKNIKAGIDSALGKAPNLPKYFENFPISNLDLGRPFDEISFTTQLKQVNEKELRDALTEEVVGLKDQEGTKTEQDPYDVPALQVSTFAPLNYLRFLNKKPKSYKFYIGGQPENAGMSDYIYVLCDKMEANNFIKEMAKFKHPTNFYKNLNALSDIDPAFKNLEPREYKPSGSILLEAIDKFDLTAKHDPVKGTKIEDLEDWQEKNKGVKPITQLQLLMQIASKFLGNKTMPGTFMKGTYGIGNMIVHFNRDNTKCIMWASKPSVSVDKTKIMELVNSFVEKLEDSYI